MTAATADAVDVDEKGGKKKLVFIIIGVALVIVLAAGGLFVKSMMSANSAPAPDPAKENGSVVALADEMTLNLADGHFLKTQLSLQLSEAETTAIGEKAVAAYDGSMARDAAISVLSKYTYKQLLNPTIRTEAQTKLSELTKERYDGKVLRVYFTQFVMQ